MHPFLSLSLFLAAAATAAAQDPPTPPKPKAEAPKAEAPKAEAPKVLSLGDKLPTDLVLRDLEGKEHKLADLRGKTVVVHFWSSTCPWEVVAEPKINALSKDYADKGVVVLGLAANAGEIGEPPDPKAFESKEPDQRPYGKLRQKAKEVGMNHPLLVDHGAVLGKLLDGKTTPHMFVFDKAGTMVYTGALDDDGKGQNPERAANYVRNAVNAVLAGEKVEVAQTKPYG